MIHAPIGRRHFYDKQQSPLRGYTLLADSHGILWLGSEKGQLYYYTPSDREQVDKTDFHLLEHLLLLRIDDKSITGN